MPFSILNPSASSGQVPLLSILNSRGFSLIELLVVITIIGIIGTAGVAGYSKFNKRQLVITAGKEMLVNIRQTQSKALSNVKTAAGCSATPLAGYVVSSSPDLRSYSVSETYTAPCAPGNASSVEIKKVTLPTGLTFQSGFSLSFLGLPGKVTFAGASPYNLVICGSSCSVGTIKYTLSVSSDGLVQDIGVPANL